MKVFFDILGKAWKVLACILAILMGALVLIVFWQVICRFVLKDSTGWTGEISTLIFVWATYLGAALAIHQGSQISMTLLVVKAKRPLRQIIVLIQALVCEVFYAVFMMAGIQAMQKFANVTTPSLNLPMPVAYSAIAVSGAIMLLYGIGEIIKPILELARPRQDAAQA